MANNLALLDIKEIFVEEMDLSELADLGDICITFEAGCGALIACGHCGC